MRRITRGLVATTAAAGLLVAGMHSRSPEEPFFSRPLKPYEPIAHSVVCDRIFADSIPIGSDVQNVEAFRSSTVRPADQELQRQVCERAQQLGRFMISAKNNNGHSRLEQEVKIFSRYEGPITEIVTMQKESDSEAAVGKFALSKSDNILVAPERTILSVSLVNDYDGPEEALKNTLYTAEFYSIDSPEGTRWVAEQTKRRDGGPPCLSWSSNYDTHTNNSLQWCPDGADGEQTPVDTDPEVLVEHEIFTHVVLDTLPPFGIPPHSSYY